MSESFTTPNVAEGEQSSLSYKFQRLRERLRSAIASGELSGKLPGERALAKQFHVNAKTLSKALTDLAAEGLLDRSIGRGTFVKGSEPAVSAGKRWLVICDPGQVNGEAVRLLREANKDLEVLIDVSAARPSFLIQFSAVIDLAGGTPESFIRDLVVRSLPVVLVGKEPTIYSTHAVLSDIPHATAQLGRELLLGGHRKLAVVEPPRCSDVADALRHTAARYGIQASIDSCHIHELSAMVEHGVTAVVCRSLELGVQAKKYVEGMGLSVPQQISIAAVGAAPVTPAVSGVYVQQADKISAVIQLLSNQSSRPLTLWLAGKSHDRGTIAPLAEVSAQQLVPELLNAASSEAAA